MALTFEELKTQVDFAMLEKLAKGLNVHPSQLFSFDEIKKDREFLSEFQDIDNLKKSIEEKDQKLEELNKTNSDLKRATQLQTAKGTLSKLYKENNLTDNITKFIDGRYDKLKDNLEDISDDGLKKFVEDQTEIYREANGKTEDKTPSIPSGDGDDTQDDKENPFVDFNEEDY
jgi:predicted nuclease with TOPRIM domain